MTNYFPRNFDLSNNTFSTTIFNTDDFNYLNGYATIAQLQSYANLTTSNVFQATNYFQDIFVQNINGVSSTALGYLSHINEDVQYAIDALQSGVSELLNITQAISYDASSNSTYVDNNLITDNFGSSNVAISNNIAISGQVNADKINTFSIFTNNVNSNSIISNNIQCNNLINTSDVCVFLSIPIVIATFGSTYNTTLITYPLNCSQNVTDLFSNNSNNFQCVMTVKNGYLVEFYDSNNGLVFSYDNRNSTKFIYNVQVNLSVSISKINIYYGYALLT